MSNLINNRWPPVGDFSKFNKEFYDFIYSSIEDKKNILKELRKNHEEHSEFIQVSLGEIYGYSLGYQDSPVYIKENDLLEIKLEESKIILEREMLDFWLKPTTPPKGMNQKEASEYLKEYINNNSGVYHEFFEYVKSVMNQKDFLEFLYFETIRNEVVDDEVGLILIGMQGEMKKVIAENLWDECGNGNLKDFHTYWLKRLLNKTKMDDKFVEYRENSVPWFTKITSNSFNMMGTRSPYKYRAYGHFLITESWVNPHFNRVIDGLNRVGLKDEDIQIYFTKHCTIDPFHTEEMLKALENQEPKLTNDEVYEVLLGAHTAVEAGTKLSNNLINYFLLKNKENKEDV